jgi:hypothetical protein
MKVTSIVHWEKKVLRHNSEGNPEINICLRTSDSDGFPAFITSLWPYLHQSREGDPLPEVDFSSGSGQVNITQQDETVGVSHWRI